MRGCRSSYNTVTCTSSLTASEFLLFAFLLIAFVLSYLIWLRRLVFNIPAAVRFGLSVLPTFLLYRAGTGLYTLFIYRGYPQLPGRSPHAVEILIAAMGLACLALFHIWRGVKPDDFRHRKESDTVSIFGRSD